MRSLANWLKLLSLKPSSHSRCSSALSSSLFHGAATPPSPATPTPASLQVTSIPPPLQHPHQHPYRLPLYPPSPPPPPLQRPQHRHEDPREWHINYIRSLLTGVSLILGCKFRKILNSNQRTDQPITTMFQQLYNPSSLICLSLNLCLSVCLSLTLSLSLSLSVCVSFSLSLSPCLSLCLCLSLSLSFSLPPPPPPHFTRERRREVGLGTGGKINK